MWNITNTTIHLKRSLEQEINYYLILLTGGGLTLTWYTYMCLPFGVFFTKFGIAIGGFSSETKEPKFHKLGVFWTKYCKKHPIWSKLGAFLSKMVY